MSTTPGIQPIRLREPGKLATTGITNELAEAIGMLGAPVLGHGGYQEGPRPSGLIQIYNNSDTDVATGGVLMLESSSYNPATDLANFIGQYSFIGNKPTADGYGRFCIALEAIPKQTTGLAIVSGWALCQVDFGSQSWMPYADITEDDSAKLTGRGMGSAQVLLTPTGTGVKWSLVRIGAGASNATFPVALTQTGGSAGDSTHACSFTYTVKTPDGNVTLGTGVGVEKPRLFNATMTAATKGIAYYDGATLKLWDVGEVFTQTNCT